MEHTVSSADVPVTPVFQILEQDQPVTELEDHVDLCKLVSTTDVDKYPRINVKLNEIKIKCNEEHKVKGCQIILPGTQKNI